MHQSLLQIYSPDSIMFGMLFFICTVYQISCSHEQRNDFILERKDILSAPVMSVLRKANPRSIEILVHAKSDAIAYDLVCASILKEFPTKVLKFEDQGVSEIPPRMRPYEDLVVLYLYTGYQCPNQEESREVVKKMRGLHWWFLRVKLLLVTSTIIDCHTIKYLFEEFHKYELYLHFAITSTKNSVTFYRYDLHEKMYENINIWNLYDILQKYHRLDMFGHQIRSSTVNDPPLTLIERDDKTGIVLKIEGFGHEIMKEFCKVLNASYFIIPRLNDDYGLWLRNGTITGVFEDILSRKADINPHGLHMFDYGEDMDNVEFVGAIYYDEVWALIPKNRDQSISQLTGLFVVLCMMGLIIVLIWLVAYLLRFQSPMRDPLMIFAILMGFGSPRIPAASCHKIFLYSWIVGTIFLSSYFQTALIHTMSFRKIPKDIETLKELEASGRNVLMFSGVIDIAYASIEDKGPYINRLRNRTMPGPYRNSCAERLLDSWSANASCTPGSYQANAYIHTMLQNGQQALVTTKERFFGSWQTFLVRRGTHWVPHMRKFILDLQQSGLITKWLTDHMIDKNQPNSTLTFRPLTMDTFSSIVVITTWCSSLSVLTFVFEFAYFHSRKRVTLWLRSVCGRHDSVRDQTAQ